MRKYKMITCTGPGQSKLLGARRKKNLETSAFSEKQKTKVCITYFEVSLVVVTGFSLSCRVVVALVSKVASDTDGGQMVHQVASMSEYQANIGKQGLVVVDFYATWCGPCKMIAPVLEQMSQVNTAVTFIKVDVDELEDVAGMEGIQAMPTFIFYVNGEKKETLKGANKAKLEELVAKYSA